MGSCDPEVGDRGRSSVASSSGRGGASKMRDRRSTSTSAGGFVPYSSFIRKQPTMSTYTPSLWSRQENSADTSVPSWHTAHAVGDPRYTAFDINDRGNRIYLKYEPSQPTIFPTRETRFYKPK